MRTPPQPAERSAAEMQLVQIVDLVDELRHQPALIDLAFVALNRRPRGEMEKLEPRALVAEANYDALRALVGVELAEEDVANLVRAFIWRATSVPAMDDDLATREEVLGQALKSLAKHVNVQRLVAVRQRWSPTFPPIAV